MGFNRRKMQANRKAKTDAAAAARRATDAQVLEDAERLIAAWNKQGGDREFAGRWRWSCGRLDGRRQTADFHVSEIPRLLFPR